MECSGQGTEAVLKELLRLSAEQARMLGDGDFDGILAVQDERESLFEVLRQSLEGSPGEREALKPEIESVIESDRALCAGIEAAMGEISSRLKKINDGSAASRAYSR